MSHLLLVRVNGIKGAHLHCSNLQVHGLPIYDRFEDSFRILLAIDEKTRNLKPGHNYYIEAELILDRMVKGYVRQQLVFTLVRFEADEEDASIRAILLDEHRRYLNYSRALDEASAGGICTESIRAALNLGPEESCEQARDYLMGLVDWNRVQLEERHRQALH